ncbi:BQ5605_C001g00511 [Microbotryum silenes-dioicae]|uniref:BQ5605_C001g00511 protein n=1 Tax=Microbotryum silenes-dioicae TaxID=796604 RepID=A0A2X0P099_9BASI|nr:BQ5605_C001g00511 [Microbotryum silenes-dioicae]
MISRVARSGTLQLRSRASSVAPAQRVRQTVLRTMSTLPVQRPHVVAVVGTTGVGKTKLGVELAQAVASMALSSSSNSGAEVINSDSMQVYKGLDLITNKATVEEMQGIKHHLMAFLEPGQEYSINEFQADALRLIDDMRNRDTLPILVGGTTYYLQHLVFPNQLVSDTPAISVPRTTPTEPLPISATHHFPPKLVEHIHALPHELLQLFLALPCLPQTSTPDSFPPNFPLGLVPEPYRSPSDFAPALYDLLDRLDPRSAERWHWRDIRKVRRALEIVWEGRQWDDVKQEQNQKGRGQARFPTLIFWPYAEPELLSKRLDERVDRMLQLGLLEEIEQLWALAHRKGGEGSDETDYSKGVYQAIGYKEFSPYLASKNDSSIDSKSLFDAAVERMKISTRQYAKKQVKWIKSKLLPAIKELETHAVTIVLLDVTDLEKWEENVHKPAIEYLRAFLNDEPITDPALLSPVAQEHLSVSNTGSPARPKRACPICTDDPSRPFFVEYHLWDSHSRTKTHRRRLREVGTRGRRPPQREEREEREERTK